MKNTRTTTTATRQKNGTIRLVVTERTTYVIESATIAADVRQAVKDDDKERIDELINFLADDGADDVITECVGVEVIK